MSFDKSNFSPRKNRKRGYAYPCKACNAKSLRERWFKPLSEGSKNCTVCKINKGLTEFFACHTKKDGRESACKVCSQAKRMVRLNTRPECRIVENLRRRTRAVLAGINKSKATLALIGCDPIYLKEHLEGQFTSGMSWDNYGEWHIDHIVPCNDFDLTKPEEQSKCFHYTNLQPLWAIDNLKKGIG